MYDADKIIKMKKILFEACLTMVFVIGSYKRKYWGLTHDFSIQYTSKNNQYLKTLQGSVDVKRKENFIAEKNNDKSNTHKHKKNLRW